MAFASAQNSPRLVVLLFWLGLSACGCARASVPDPKDAVRVYADAARHRDADRIYALLTPEAQRDFGRAGTRRLVSESGPELVRQAQAFSEAAPRVEATAEVRFADGENAVLALDHGSFKVSSAGPLPGLARTPADALDQLRRALARRSYAALIGVLSSETRGAVEGDMKSLVLGLENPEALDIRVSGDNALVRTPGGHQVKLKREAGVWRVQDFD